MVTHYERAVELGLLNHNELLKSEDLHLRVAVAQLHATLAVAGAIGDLWALLSNGSLDVNAQVYRP